jgi:hypothetical protein
MRNRIGKTVGLAAGLAGGFCLGLVLGIAGTAVSQTVSDYADSGELPPGYDSQGGLGGSDGLEVHGRGTHEGGVHGRVSESPRLGEEVPRDPIGTADPMPRKPFKLPDGSIPESDYDDVVSQTEVFGAEAGTAIRFTRPSVTRESGSSAADGPRTITGLFSVRNKYRRTFDIDGRAGVYVAPREENLYRLDKQQVKITLDEKGEIVKIEPEISVD